MIWTSLTRHGGLGEQGCGQRRSAHCSSLCRGSQGEQMTSQTANFEGLLETASDALVGVDEDGVIRFVNRQSESLFGYERDDVVGQPIEILVPESLRAAHRVHRQDYVRH